jgi:predicted dehydrogenase
MTPLRVGIVGCGNISGIYFKNLGRFRSTEIVACADLDLDRARAAAESNGVSRACSTEELLAESGVDLILNLTVPNAHASVALAAVEAGKHVYNEKPLTISREEGKHLIDLARQKNVRVGCAPDTFMGGGIQTCRKLIDDGAIGEPIAAQAFMLCHGHESWHPSPEFYYEKGGGPMFDMGPYYLTALVALMGPIRAISGSARITFPKRTITSQPKHGKTVEVETPTHIAGIMEFGNGAIGEITTSFDVWYSKHPPITIHGTEGSMLVGDPNSFGDNVYWRRKGDSDWRWQPLTHGFADNSRGVGVLDIAHAIDEGRAHRASGDLAYHVLDAMHAFLDSSDQGRKIELTSGVDRPAPMTENEFAADLEQGVPAGV